MGWVVIRQFPFGERVPFAVWGPLAVRALLIAILAMLLARLLWVSITPVFPLGDYKMARGQVPAPAIRSVLLGGVDPFDGGATSMATSNVTSLDLELFGIRQNLGSGSGAAIIGTPDGQQINVQVGREIIPGAVLAAVAFDHVVIDRGGIEERLYLDESQPTSLVAPDTAPAAAAANNAPTVSAATLDQAVRLTPRMRGNAVTGINVAPGPDSAMFSSLGLRPSDVIVQINGVSVTDASDLEQLRRELRPGARLTLGVERGADMLPVVVTIPQ